MKKKTIIGVALASLLAIGCATTGISDHDAREQAIAVMKQSFVTKGIANVDRLDQDEVQRLCTQYSNGQLPPEVAQKIEKEQLATIKLPASGKLIGNWKEGEKIAQLGRGLQFSDQADGAQGGNCYACHQLAPQEISYGNIGPSLYNYGKLRGQSAEIVAYTYGKVYNSQAYSACSSMPRFGHKQILTPQQIADVVALLVDPASPVNK